MYCVNCGKALGEDVKFCVHCGASASEENFAGEKVGDSDKQPNPKTLKWITIGAVAVILVVVLIVVSANIAGSPLFKMHRALTKHQVEYAAHIFEDDLHKSDLKDRSYTLLEKNISYYTEAYIKDEIEWSEFKTAINCIESFDLYDLEDAVDAAWNTTEDKHTIEVNLEEAESYLELECYFDAMKSFNEVLEQDGTNEDALSGFQEAKDEALEVLSDLIAGAMDEYELWYVLSLVCSYKTYFPENDADYEAYVESFLELYFNEMNAIVDAYDPDVDDDYDIFVSVIDEAEGYIGSDNEMLQELRESLKQKELAYIENELATAAEISDTESIEAILYEYQEAFPEEIESLRSEIYNTLPETLLTLFPFDSYSLQYIFDTVEDRNGNTYLNAVNYDGSTNAYGIYELDGEYSWFTATVFVPEEASDGKDMAIYIYLDDELVYEMEGITETTEPFSIAVDLDGASEMRIETSNDGTFSCGFLYFVNSLFS